MQQQGLWSSSMCSKNPSRGDWLPCSHCVVTSPCLVTNVQVSLPLSSAPLLKLFLLWLKASGPELSPAEWHGANTVAKHMTNIHCWRERPEGARWVEIAHSRRKAPACWILYSRDICTAESEHPSTSVSLKLHTHFISSSRAAVWLIFSSEGLGGLLLRSKAIPAGCPPGRSMK